MDNHNHPSIMSFRIYLIRELLQPMNYTIKTHYGIPNKWIDTHLLNLQNSFYYEQIRLFGKIHDYLKHKMFYPNFWNNIIEIF